MEQHKIRSIKEMGSQMTTSVHCNSVLLWFTSDLSFHLILLIPTDPKVASRILFYLKFHVWPSYFCTQDLHTSIIYLILESFANPSFWQVIQGKDLRIISHLHIGGESGTIIGTVQQVGMMNTINLHSVCTLSSSTAQQYTLSSAGNYWKSSM